MYAESEMLVHHSEKGIWQAVRNWGPGENGIYRCVLGNYWQIIYEFMEVNEITKGKNIKKKRIIKDILGKLKGH